MGDTGLEPGDVTTESVCDLRGSVETGGAKSGAFGSGGGVNGHGDAGDLAERLAAQLKGDDAKLRRVVPLLYLYPDLAPEARAVLRELLAAMEADLAARFDPRDGGVLG
jgi:hypothetical protein